MSTARHPLPDELELYVLGALDGETALRLERHVHRCPPCAAALAEEARLEETLRALVPAARARAQVVRLPAPPTPAPRPRAGLSGTMAAAAAVVLAVWGLEGGRGPSGGRSLGVAAASVASDGSGLACELEGEAPQSRWPAVMASMLPAAPPEENVCRAPVGGSCAVQSRTP
jgi:anti-sigma factor RsiW